MRTVRKLRKHTYLRARATAPGRAALRALEVASAPLEYLQRRRAAVACTGDAPPLKMPDDAGYLVLPPDAFAGTSAALASCRQLFEIKKAEADGAALNATARTKGRKKEFLKNLLDDEDLRRHPELVEFALQEGLLAAVSAYLGVVPRLTRIDLVYSVPREQQDLVASQLFHQDPEGLTQAKVFIYVFDVGEEQGPLMLVPAGTSERLVQAIARRRRATGEPNERRYFDREIESEGGRDAIVRVTGPAGTGVIVDTSRCLHAGSRVQPGAFRLCLFIQYCTTPEPGNQFDIDRFARDRVRRLALTQR